MEAVNVEAQWLHPVPTIQKIPVEFEAELLAIMEQLWVRVAEAVVAQDTAAQVAAERLLHVLPKMLLAQPQRPRARSEDAQPFSQQAAESRA
eukprot:9642427-Karenia_brevis.AAC.1